MGMNHSSSTQVPQHFVGSWSNNDSASMDIESNGQICYVKSESGPMDKWNAPVRYSDDGFKGRYCCCFSIKGIYNGSNPQRPTFTINGDVLTKEITQQPGRKY
ncbi:hypothetical protein I4U23_005362 [Adineta vaga]|nr:hypothetical protein I4U23_005362 [Adineta vaga]